MVVVADANAAHDSMMLWSPVVVSLPESLPFFSFQFRQYSIVSYRCAAFIMTWNVSVAAAGLSVLVTCRR